MTRIAPRSRRGHRNQTYTVKISLFSDLKGPAGLTPTGTPQSTVSTPPSVKEVQYKVNKPYNKSSKGLGGRLAIPTSKKKKKKKGK